MRALSRVLLAASALVLVLSAHLLDAPAAADPRPKPDHADTMRTTPPPTLAPTTTTTTVVCDPACQTWALIATARAADESVAGQPLVGRCYGPCHPTWRACALPDYICRRESNFTSNVKNASSSASGKYQFLDSTWRSTLGRMGGWYPPALDRWPQGGSAPEYLQDEVAAFLWAGGAGCSHWSACR